MIKHQKFDIILYSLFVVDSYADDFDSIHILDILFQFSIFIRNEA